MKFGYAITTYGQGSFLKTTLDSIPDGSVIEVIDTKQRNWPLAKGWNYAMDRFLWDLALDAVIISNDDVVFRPDTGELLAWGILEGQFDKTSLTFTAESGTKWLSGYMNYWPDTRPELLLLSARHAHWSDACTDIPDQQMLKDAIPIWQPGPDFSCFCVSRRLGQVIGRFDENYSPAYFEDNDTHRRIQLAGYDAGAFAPYWHFRNGTTRTDPERAAAVHASFENCKKYYCDKWGAPYDGASPIGRETYLVPFNKV